MNVQLLHHAPLSLTITAIRRCYLSEGKSDSVWTINARSLRNFLSLRSSKRALWEMRELAGKVFAALPDDHQFLFIDCMEMTHENL